MAPVASLPPAAALAAAILLLAPGPPAAPDEPAAGRLLVASPGLSDPSFDRSVVLLIEANENGAWGLILNRPTELEVGRVFPDAAAFRGRADLLHFGGPVDGRKLFALARGGSPRGEWAAVLPGVRLVWSLEAIDDLARRGLPCRVFAGYAGWAPGQLGGEIARGDWRVTEADEALIFDSDGPLLWELLTRRAATLVVEARRAPLPLRPGG